MIRRLLRRDRGESRSEGPYSALIVGLGNPGRRYAQTRHNVGFEVVDELTRRFESNLQRQRFQATIIEASTNGTRVVLAKPETMMNLSGQAVAQIARWYRCTPGQTLVIYDDLDLPFGRLRLRAGGGAGGHNGVRSIIQQLGTPDFHRLRIGIGRPPAGGDAVNYVLSRFRSEEAQLLPDVIGAASDAATSWLLHGIDEAANTYNRGDLLTR